jgi:hypothetical protein
MRRGLLFIGAVAIGTAGVVSAVSAMQAGLPDIVGQMGLKPGHWRTTIQVVDTAIIRRRVDRSLPRLWKGCSR